LIVGHRDIYYAKKILNYFLCVGVRILVGKWNIQVDSEGICDTLRNDSMSDSKQKVHTNMGPILNGYGVTGIF
jgi:hypothetical protein